MGKNALVAQSGGPSPVINASLQGVLEACFDNSGHIGKVYASWHGIEGVLSWTVNGTRIDVGPGQALCIPRGAVHRFDNHGSQDVKALCVITPAAIGPQFFRESAAVIDAAAGGPPDRVKMADVMRRHGLTPAA